MIPTFRPYFCSDRLLDDHLIDTIEFEAGLRYIRSNLIANMKFGKFWTPINQCPQTEKNFQY